MLQVKELEDNVIELKNGITHYEFNVISKGSNGSNKSFSVELVTNDLITVKPFDLNSISIDIDIPNIVNEECIILKNTLNEMVEIKVIPDEYYTMEKEYKFKITKKVYNDDGSFKIKILSTMNDSELGWRCIYDGKPMSYLISPRESDGSCYVTIKYAATVVMPFNSLLKFKQNESGNIIDLVLYNTPEGIKKKVD